MPAPPFVFQLNTDNGLYEDLFVATIFADGLRHITTEHWAAEEITRPLLPGCDVVCSWDGITVARVGAALVKVAARGTAVMARVAAATAEEGEEAMAEVRRLVPEAAKDESTPSARVTFWNWSELGAQSRPSVLATPTWDEVRGNYAASVQAPLDELMSRTSPPDGGRLLLWHGPPGTGKTHLIRALSHAWQEWCGSECIVDVDQLLHGSTQYLTSLVLDGTSDGPEWRLLILEDAGEFLLADAARTQGQGFSKLLNTLDGMLGQSAKLVVLVTTNRPLNALDPAITRPGRCAMELEVPSLSAGEAARWLADRGHATPVGAKATLAELYGVLRGDPPPAPRRAVGFSA